MRKALFLVEIISLLGFASLLSLAQAQRATQPEKATLSINKIMGAAHVRDIDGKGNRGSKRNLDTRVLGGNATDAEKQRLLELYRLLAQANPPKGSIGKWRRYTEPLVAAMEGVVAGREGATSQLAGALDCKACHEQFRMRFAPDLSNLTDLKSYQILRESGQFTEASKRSLPPRELVELAGKVQGAGGSPTIEQVGDGPEGWSLLVDFPEKTTDDTLRLFDSVQKLSAIRILKGGVTDEEVGHLRDLPDLQVLVVNSKEITDDGMRSIAAQKSLVNLDLLQARITGRGLASLAGLSRLKELYLHAADVRDADVEPLKAMKNLDWLYLPSAVTKAKLEELGLALPRTHIVGDVAR